MRRRRRRRRSAPDLMETLKMENKFTQGVKKNAPTTSAADMKSPLPLLLSSPAAIALSPLALTSPLPPQPPQLCLFHRCRPSSRCRLGPLLCCGVPRRRPSSLSCRLSPRSFACFTAAGQAPVAASAPSYVVASPGAAQAPSAAASAPAALLVSPPPAKLPLQAAAAAAAAAAVAAKNGPCRIRQ